MANLMNTIPVRKPQNTNIQPSAVQTTVVKPQHTQKAFKDLVNPYPQLEKYEYAPAKPISPARTRTKFTRPVAATGKIINENIFKSAYGTVKSYGEYAKNFYNAAFKGEGDDYKVGKINDLSIRAGSLGIASIIATTKFFPFAKGMEFVGLGTWFAAMALWPEIIGAPIKAMTGVDINQKYKDNYGRVKCVFEDNQYRPMDLYRHLDENGKQLDEKEYYQKYQYDYVYLDKLADKLGIPKDKKNRHEAVMEKMGQIAVQGRTLSMMTAGVMTPVLSSVIADALQTPFKKTIGLFRENKNLSEMNKISNVMSELDTSKDLTNRVTDMDLDEVMKKLDVEVPQNTLNKLDALLTDEKYLSKAQYEELNKFMREKACEASFEEAYQQYTRNNLSFHEPKVSLNKELYEKLKNSTAESVKKFISGLDKEVADTIPENIKNYSGITEEEFVASIKESAIKSRHHAENYGKGIVDELNTEEIASLKDTVVEKVGDFLKKEKLDRSAVSEMTNQIEGGLKKVIDGQKHHVIEPSRDKIVELFKFIETNKSMKNKIASFEKATIANISESVTANNWEKVPVKYLDILGFEKDEIAKIATMESSQASKVISKRFEKIASDEKLYAKTIKEMSKVAAEAIAKEENAVWTLVGTMKDGGVLTKTKDLMSSVANFHFGEEMEKTIEKMYSNQMKDAQYKLRNTTDSFIRPIKALDTFRNISESVDLIIGHNEAEFKEALKNKDFYMFSNMNYETAKKSLIKFLKDIALDKNDINNWTTKMEHDIPQAKKGMKHSYHLIHKIAEVVNGSLHHETASIIDSEEQKTIRNYIDQKQYKDAFKKMMRRLSQKVDKTILEKFKLNQISDMPLKFSQKIDLNNSIMRFRFLNIENPLFKNFDKGECYVQDFFPAETMLRDICEGNSSNLYFLRGWLSERREEINMDGIDEIKSIINKVAKGEKPKLQVHFKDLEAKRKSIFGNLDFKSANKGISEMSGKNVTDFVVSAAQNSRSRSKWLKVAYGLLIGTTALTAYVISQIGKDNYFNKSNNESNSQGAGR